MNPHVTSWWMTCAALVLLVVAGRWQIILIAGPVSLVAGLLATQPAAYDSVKY